MFRDIFSLCLYSLGLSIRVVFRCRHSLVRAGFLFLDCGGVLAKRAFGIEFRFLGKGCLWREAGLLGDGGRAFSRWFPTHQGWLDFQEAF